MIRRPPRSTRTDTLCPYTTLFRSLLLRCEGPVLPLLAHPSPRGSERPASPSPPAQATVNALPGSASLAFHAHVSVDAVWVLEHVPLVALACGVEQPADVRLAPVGRHLNRLHLGPPSHPWLALSTEQGTKTSEARRVGHECVSTCRSRRSRYHK